MWLIVQDCPWKDDLHVGLFQQSSPGRTIEHRVWRRLRHRDCRVRGPDILGLCRRRRLAVFLRREQLLSVRRHSPEPGAVPRDCH